MDHLRQAQDFHLRQAEALSQFRQANATTDNPTASPSPPRYLEPPPIFWPPQQPDHPPPAHLLDQRLPVTPPELLEPQQPDQPPPAHLLTNPEPPKNFHPFWTPYRNAQVDTVAPGPNATQLEPEAQHGMMPPSPLLFTTNPAVSMSDEAATAVLDQLCNTALPQDSSRLFA